MLFTDNSQLLFDQVEDQVYESRHVEVVNRVTHTFLDDLARRSSYETVRIGKFLAPYMASRSDGKSSRFTFVWGAYALRLACVHTSNRIMTVTRIAPCHELGPTGTLGVKEECKNCLECQH